MAADAPDLIPPVRLVDGYPPGRWRHTSGWHRLRDITCTAAYFAYWDWSRQVWRTGREWYGDVPPFFMRWQAADGDETDYFAEWFGPAGSSKIPFDRVNWRARHGC